MKSREYGHLFKLVLVGNSSVGKSSILLSFADGTFTDSYYATIGVDFRFKSVMHDSEKVKLQIWDTAGQERFRTITSSYYKGAHVFFITFDITSQVSYQDAIKFWLSEVKTFCHPETLLILVGNKADLQEQRQVTREEASGFAKRNGLEYFETSAKDMDNIQETFRKVVHLLIKRSQEKQEGRKQSQISHKKLTISMGNETEKRATGMKIADRVLEYKSACCSN